jgi:hypothetical protein
MDDFLWKIAGANVTILKDSDKTSQSTFRIIGQLFLIIIAYVFVALLTVFYEISNDFTIGVLLGSILTFLICNIYFINILDLEPRTLPRKKEKKSLFLSYFTKYFFISLFSLFVIKCMEIFLFKHLFSLSFNYEASMIHKELIELHQEHPEIWIFTAINSFLFYTPIFMKFRLKRKAVEANENKEKSYFEIKRTVDIFIVEEDYKKFKIQREKILNTVYLDYVKLNELFNEVAQKNGSLKSLSHQYRIRKPKALKEIYVDPPFNTIKISDLNNQISSSHEEYLNTLTENGKLAEGN